MLDVWGRIGGEGWWERVDSLGFVAEKTGDLEVVHTRCV